jgi:hypothetical protein
MPTNHGALDTEAHMPNEQRTPYCKPIMANSTDVYIMTCKFSCMRSAHAQRTDKKDRIFNLHLFFAVNLTGRKSYVSQ